MTPHKLRLCMGGTNSVIVIHRFVWFMLRFLSATSNRVCFVTNRWSLWRREGLLKKMEARPFTALTRGSVESTDSGRHEVARTRAAIGSRAVSAGAGAYFCR